MKHSHSTSPASLSDFPPVFRFISRFRYFRRPLRYLLTISQNTCHTSYRFLRYLCPVSIFVESRVPQVSSLVEHWLSAWLLLSLASFRFASSSRSCESRHEVSLKSNLVSVFSLKISLSTDSVSSSPPTLINDRSFIHSHPLILPSREGFHLLFFPHSNRALLRILSSHFSLFLCGLYTGAFPCRLRRSLRIFSICLKPFSVSLRSALPFRSSYFFPPSALLFLLPARFTRPRSMFARFNFPEAPLLPVFTRIAPHRVLSASALHLLCSRTFRGFCSSICAFPTAPFSPLCPPLSLSPSVVSTCSVCSLQSPQS